MLVGDVQPHRVISPMLLRNANFRFRPKPEMPSEQRNVCFRVDKRTAPFVSGASAPIRFEQREIHNEINSPKCRWFAPIPFSGLTIFRTLNQRVPVETRCRLPGRIERHEWASCAAFWF